MTRALSTILPSQRLNRGCACVDILDSLWRLMTDLFVVARGAAASPV